MLKDGIELPLNVELVLLLDPVDDEVIELLLISPKSRSRYFEKSQQPLMGDRVNTQHCPLARPTNTRPLKCTICNMKSGSLTLAIHRDHWASPECTYKRPF